MKATKQERSRGKATVPEASVAESAFFADAAAFDALSDSIFPELIKSHPPGAPLRIWVSGCGWGAVVYSLAIRLLEFLGESAGTRRIKIFGTDSSPRAIALAREGAYPASALKAVESRRLRRFFAPLHEAYRVANGVRDQCVFAVHQPAIDPPFHGVDLIRGTLPAAGSARQDQVLREFQFALNPGGILWLPAGELPDRFSKAFVRVENCVGFYRCGAEAKRHAWIDARPSVPCVRIPAPPPRRRMVADLERDADRAALARFAPPAVVVNERFQVLEFRGNTGKWLRPPSGPPTLDLLCMAREGLMGPLRSVLDQARRDGTAVRRDPVSVEFDGEYREVALEVLPVTAGGARCFVVLFEEIARPAKTAKELQKAAPPRLHRRLKILEGELAASRANQEAALAAYETSNEELMAANEEISAANEELQSTNEQLEVTQEELQATNEELATMNDELERRIETALRLGDDLANLIDTLDVPMIVVAQDLRIRRFNPSASRVFNVLHSDLGRPIGHLRPRIKVPELESWLREVMETLSDRQCEVCDDRGRWYAMSIRVYRAHAQKIDGAVITLVDIDLLKRRERQIRQARDYAESIVQNLPQPLVILNRQVRVRSANAAFYGMFRTTCEQTVGWRLQDLGDGHWNVPHLMARLEDSLASGQPFSSLEIEEEFPGIGWRRMALNGLWLPECDDQPDPLFLLAITDLTERVALEREVLDIATQEQLRIGQDLHDGLGQALTGLGLLSRDLVDHLEAAESPLANPVRKIHTGLGQALKEVREVARGLSPVEIDAEGLRSALTELVARTQDLHRIDCRLECHGSLKIWDNRIATHLYRIAQEAVTNALRHSGARRIELCLETNADSIVLLIRDDGVGIAPRTQETAGIGLRIMAYRARLIGAVLDLSRGPDGGTCIRCTVPRKVGYDRRFALSVRT